MNVAVRIECAAQHELYLSDNRHYSLYSELIGVIKDLRRRVLGRTGVNGIIGDECALKQSSANGAQQFCGPSPEPMNHFG